MEYFYGICFILTFTSFIVTAVGVVEPNRVTTCSFQLGMTLVCLGNFIAELKL